MYTEHPSWSPLIRCLWQVDIIHDGSWISPANEFWGLVFGEAQGRRSTEVVGPSIDPRHMSASGEGRFWGVEFEAHVFWRGLDKVTVLGEIRELAMSGTEHFELAGVRFPFTTFKDLEALVDSLVGQGVLVADPVVAVALGGDDAVVPTSERTLRRQMRSRTGLGGKQVKQLQRARAAYELLQLGTPLADAALEAGFADQAHMTRALRVFAGRTPARILADND